MTPQAAKVGGQPTESEREAGAVPDDTDAASGSEDASSAQETGDNRDSTAAQRLPAEIEGETGSRNTPTVDPSRLIAFGLLPAAALFLAGGAGYLKWQDTSVRTSQIASIEAVAAAKDATTAMLSYQAGSVDADLAAASDRMTGSFKDSYTQLTNDIVIPGAKQRGISAVATVPAAASVSARGSHAVVLVFVNQTVNVGAEPPSATASSVRVTLDKIGDRWLISGFDPV